jgi:TolB protein
MGKLIMIVLFFVTFLQADATIKIVKKIKKNPTIVVANSSDSSIDATLNRKFLKLLIGDLKVSANFKVTPNYIKASYDGSNMIGELVKNNTELLIKCKLSHDAAQKLHAKVKLINAQNGSLVYEKSYMISKKNRYPFLAHNIAIDVNNFFGAPPIDWMNKYIVFSKYTSAGKSSIIVSDYTLSFKKTLVSGGLNIFPKWANDKQDSIYYTTYNHGKPTLYLLNLYSGERTKIASSSGMIVCSDVSEDGNKLLLTMAPYDQPDIYLYDKNSGSKKRITKYRGIDVSGSFVDNDSGVVFISERLGYPNIFHKNISGGSVEQMVFHGKNNSSCTTSGNYIVYSSREKQNAFGRSVFNLYLISTQTDFIRKLTTNGKNMFPRFASDGETILFIKETGRTSSLGVLRLNANRSFLFPLSAGKIQSIDW